MRVIFGCSLSAEVSNSRQTALMSESRVVSDVYVTRNSFSAIVLGDEGEILVRLIGGAPEDDEGVLFGMG